METRRRQCEHCIAVRGLSKSEAKRRIVLRFIVQWEDEKKLEHVLVASDAAVDVDARA